VFTYTRGKGQGEGRLHSKRSIGVGGHISSTDAQAGSDDPYSEGRRREVSEEVEVDTPFVERCVGLINDDQSPVGQVHLGIVHLVDVERPLVKPRETDIAEAGFVTVNELLADRDRFETWSQICLEALFCHETCSRQILD
jgi:predicted NUDIX family phosphoesterase